MSFAHLLWQVQVEFYLHHFQVFIKRFVYFSKISLSLRLFSLVLLFFLYIDKTNIKYFNIDKTTI